MIIYLVRHGQTTGDVENRYGGDYDDHLTELGKVQSVKVAKKLAKKDIDIIYCSPLFRARETAEIINKEILVGILVVKEFKERDRYGKLSGMTKEEAQKKYPEEVGLLSHEQSVVPGSEDYESFKERINDALQLFPASQNSIIAVITHGGPIRHIFREVLLKGEIEIGDCAYAQLIFDNGEYKLGEVDGIKINT